MDIEFQMNQASSARCLVFLHLSSHKSICKRWKKVKAYLRLWLVVWPLKSNWICIKQIVGDALSYYEQFIERTDEVHHITAHALQLCTIIFIPGIIISYPPHEDQQVCCVTLDISQQSTNLHNSLYFLFSLSSIRYLFPIT